MKIKKRIGAFLLDMFIVMMVSVSLANLSYLNPYKYKYEDAASEYNTVLDKFDSSLQTDMDNMHNGKIAHIDYKKTFHILNDEVMPSLIRLEKTNVFNSLWYLIMFFLYNVIFVFFNDGQTIGKKIFKLKVVNKGSDHVTLPKLIIRSLFNGSGLFFGVNAILIIRILCTFINNPSLTIPIYYFLQVLSMVIELVFVITMLISKGSVLFNDILASTEVIDVK